MYNVLIEDAEEAEEFLKAAEAKTNSLKPQKHSRFKILYFIN